MTVVEIDGVYTKPVTVSQLFVTVAQRYSVIITAKADNKKNFVGLSINDTIRALLIYGYPKKADKVKSDFKVPDKR